MKKHKYVIMSLDGQSREVGLQKLRGGGVPHFELPALLEAGWRPVRETVISYRVYKWFKRWDSCAVLILLEREEA